MDRRRFLTAAAGLAAGTVVSGCGGCSGGGANTIKIVSSLPRTGSAQAQTDTIVNGIRMALDDYGGEVGGFKIKYEDKDDATAAQGQWDASKEADNAREAVGDADVMGFIGPYNSGAAGNSMPILNEAGLVQISPACTWPGLTKKVPGNEESGEPGIYRKSGKITFTRVCPTDTIQAPYSAVFVKELGVKSVYVLDDKEMYGAGIAKLFAQKCRDLGIEVLGHESIVATQQNFKTVIQGVKAKNPGLLYFGGTSQSGGPQIVIDMKGEGLRCPIMVPDGCYEKAFVDAAGADTFKDITCYATFGGKGPTELTGAGGEFVTKYKAKYKIDPEAYAVYGYEAGKVLLEAIKAVGKKDREAIRAAVVGTKDFDKGAVGKWSFDADGDTTVRELTISKVEGWPFKQVKSITG